MSKDDFPGHFQDESLPALLCGEGIKAVILWTMKLQHDSLLLFRIFPMMAKAQNLNSIHPWKAKGTSHTSHVCFHFSSVFAYVQKSHWFALMLLNVTQGIIEILCEWEKICNKKAQKCNTVLSYEINFQKLSLNIKKQQQRKSTTAAHMPSIDGCQWALY